MKRASLFLLALTMGAAQPNCPVALPNPIKIVEGVCFRTYKPAGSAEDRPWGEVKVMWNNLARLQFGNGEIPIIARHNGVYEQYGQIRTVYNQYRPAPLLPGPDMLIQFDIAKLGEQNPQGGGSVMPNGLTIPIVEEGSEDVFKLPLNNPNTPPKDYIYFSVSESFFMLGLTFQVRSWDQFGSQIPLPLGLMIPVFDSQTGRVVFSGGLYTSPVAGQNGVGVFMDLSDIYNVGADPLCRKDDGTSIPPESVGM